MEFLPNVLNKCIEFGSYLDRSQNDSNVTTCKYVSDATFPSALNLVPLLLQLFKTTYILSRVRHVGEKIGNDVWLKSKLFPSIPRWGRFPSASGQYIGERFPGQIFPIPKQNALFAS